VARGSDDFRRVRRPKDKEAVIDLLRDKRHGAFDEIRDVLVFAAALGYARGQRIPFDRAGESIRWETATNRRGTEMLVGLLAIASTEDKEVVQEQRFSEQILAFEEYANGGLAIIGGLLNNSTRSTREEILDLVQADLRPPTGDDALISLAEGAAWD
jgi:dnd system-associated protein 4